jgi:hypothetical protein
MDKLCSNVYHTAQVSREIFFNTISSLITTHLDTVIDCRGWGVVPYLPKNRDKLPKTKELRTTATTHKICWVDTSGIHLRKSN